MSVDQRQDLQTKITMTDQEMTTEDLRILRIYHSCPQNKVKQVREEQLMIQMNIHESEDMGYIDDVVYWQDQMTKYSQAFSLSLDLGADDYLIVNVEEWY